MWYGQSGGGPFFSLTHLKAGPKETRSQAVDSLTKNSSVFAHSHGQHTLCSALGKFIAITV